MTSDDIFTQNSLRSELRHLLKVIYVIQIYLFLKILKKFIIIRNKRDIFYNALIDYKFCFLSFMLKKEIFEKFNFDQSIVLLVILILF